MEINSWLTGKRWVALPFSDHCSPLVQNKKDIKSFTIELINTCKAINIPKLEIRHYLPSMEGLSSGDSHFIHYLNLVDKPENIFKRFRKKGVQYCIKKAAKLGIDIKQSRELESLMTFYNLHLMTRKKHGVPIQPKKYFLKFWEHLICKRMGFVMLANYGGKAIAGAVFLHSNKSLIYKYGANDPAYMSLYATHALLWEAIQWGCRSGYHVMDWGKTEKSNQGLRNFKRGWGTYEKKIEYSYIGEFPKKYTLGGNNKIGEYFIRKSPACVGRIIGAMLYKHVG
jgi:lipid II:glycine glycyltransferase (peptidoglycan interpeptide bridge formation enzyme)